VDCARRHAARLGDDDAVFAHHEAPAVLVFKELEDGAHGDRLLQMEVYRSRLVHADLLDQVKSLGILLQKRQDVLGRGLAEIDTNRCIQGLANLVRHGGRHAGFVGRKLWLERLPAEHPLTTTEHPELANLTTTDLPELTKLTADLTDLADLSAELAKLPTDLTDWTGLTPELVRPADLSSELT
jgi:hypothetical protein